MSSRFKQQCKVNAKLRTCIVRSVQWCGDDADDDGDGDGDDADDEMLIDLSTISTTMSYCALCVCI